MTCCHLSYVTGVSLSSDFIAGFCGETEEDHLQTVSLLREVQYNIGFLFAYSMRQVSPGLGGGALSNSETSSLTSFWWIVNCRKKRKRQRGFSWGTTGILTIHYFFLINLFTLLCSSATWDEKQLLLLLFLFIRIFQKINWLVSFWLCWVFVAARPFLRLWWAGSTL